MTMSPLEALNNLDNVVSQYKGTRQEHSLLLQSYQVLSNEINKSIAPEPKKPLLSKSK